MAVKIPRVLKILVRAFLLGGAAAVLLALGVWWYLHPAVTLVRGIPYGERRGETLRLDVLRPDQPNGLGVVLMASGSWRSSTNSLRPWLMAPLLRRGYTVFAVYHVSQPRATVMEIVSDVHRAVRFIRTHAADHGVDPGRLAVTGGSSGGHLSLMLATRGGPGAPAAPDPVDRVSSAVQAVAIFFPVTDLLNLGDSTENLHDGGPPKSYTRAFDQEPKNLAVWKETGREMSPIYFVTSNLPPTLVFHGDADTLVPLDQSRRFQARAREVGARVDVVVHPGFGHGPAPTGRWPSFLAPVEAVKGVVHMMLDIRRFADWFDVHLSRGTETGPARAESGDGI